MKKTIIAVLIGAIIMFIYQALSWTVSPIHKNSMKYTDRQDSILQSMQGLEEGFYRLPNVPPGTSMSEAGDLMKPRLGQPWALIEYHHEMSEDMVKPMLIGFLLDFLAVWLLVGLIHRGNFTGFSKILGVSFSVGLIIIFSAVLMDWNWWSTPMHYVTG